jgi:hypothetical protein
MGNNDLKIDTTRNDVSTDVLDKLFKSVRSTPGPHSISMTFDKSQTLRKKDFHEMERLRAERVSNQPIINDKSRDIVRKSTKFSEPIFSEARYE